MKLIIKKYQKKKNCLITKKTMLFKKNKKIKEAC